MDLELIMRLRRHFGIAHHIPGRLRVKFSLSLLSDPQARPLLDGAAAGGLPPAVRDVRVNPAARTAVIDYDAAAIRPALLDEAFRTQDGARFETLMQELKDSLKAA
jgi:hypothetical protein